MSDSTFPAAGAGGWGTLTACSFQREAPGQSRSEDLPCERSGKAHVKRSALTELTCSSDEGSRSLSKVT